MSDDLIDELRLIGCHANGDARCTCGIGHDAIARIEALTAERDALRSRVQMADVLADRAQSVFESEYHNTRHMEGARAYFRANCAALAAYREARASC